MMRVDFECDYISDRGCGLITFSMDFPEHIDPAEALDQARLAAEDQPHPKALPRGTDFVVFNVRLA